MELNYKPLQLSGSSILPYLGQSIVWHALIVLAFILIPLTLKKLNIISGDQQLVVASAAVRVDVVAMPTMTIKELRNLDQTIAKEEAKGVEAKAEKPSADESKDEAAFLKQQEKKSFMDMIKNYKEKDLPKNKKSKNEVKNEGKEDGKGKSNEKLNELIYIGNKISKGSAIVGNTSNVDQTELENYASLLPSHVKTYWKLPGYLMGKKLQCRIQVFVSRDGKILNTRIHASSGDKEFDQRAIDAIIAAEPFPQVPESIAAALIQGRILLGFPL